ncbi:hypothetical protein JHK87_006576 [Glycine soja]|nr:hypothetical protein JHK87_006576 [Glycine soja]
MARKPFKFNEDVLEQLRNGTAKFEVVSSPVPSVAAPPNRNTSLFGIGNSSTVLFARIGSSLILMSSLSLCLLSGGHSPAMKKLEHFSVQKVTGDGRCLFRALVKGMAYNKGTTLNQREERENAEFYHMTQLGTDELRMAVKEAICENEGERKLYEEALIAITVDEPIKRYCQRIVRPDFWGGESELLSISNIIQKGNPPLLSTHQAQGREGVYWKKPKFHIGKPIDTLKVCPFSRARLKSLLSGKMMDEYLHKIKNYVDELASVGVPVRREEHVDVILEGLPSDYAPVVFVIESKKCTPSIAKIEALLYGHETRLVRYNRDTQVLVSSSVNYS